MTLFRRDIIEPFAPRAFQQVGFDNLISTNDNVLVSAFVGAGKSHLMLMLAKHYIEQGKRVLVSMHRLTIMSQFIEDAELWGFSFGVIQGNHELTNPLGDLQIGMVQTLTRREEHEFDVWLCDEVHYQTKGFFDLLQGSTARKIAFSATPFHANLPKLFTRVLNLSNAAELTQLGILAPLKIISGKMINTKSLGTDSYGEYKASDIETATSDILGDIVKLYKEHANGKRALIFGSRISHAQMMSDALNDAGVPSAVFCADTPSYDREILIQKFKEGEILCLATVEALSTGFNIPAAEVMFSVRPLRKAFSTFVQCLGRILRASEGKEQALLIDCDGNIKRFADDYIELFLNGVTDLSASEKKDKEIRKDKPERKDKEKPACDVCGSSLWLKNICLACGNKIKVHCDIEHITKDVEFKELDIFSARKGKTNSNLWGEVSYYVINSATPWGFDKTKATKKALAIYKNITGEFPKFGQELAPSNGISKEVAGKIKQLQIAYLKGKQSWT